MPANTPFGYPYPLPTEPVTDGAMAIRNLAEAIPVTAARKWARVTAGAGQNNAVAVNTIWSLVNFATVEADTDTMFSAGAPNKLTCKTPGMYAFAAQVTLDGTSGGAARGIMLRIEKAAGGLVDIVTEVLTALTWGAIIGFDDTQMIASGFHPMLVNDIITMRVFQDSGAARNVNQAMLSAVRIGP